MYSKTTQIIGSRNEAIEGILEMLSEESQVEWMLNKVVCWWLTPCYLVKLSSQAALSFWKDLGPPDVPTSTLDSKATKQVKHCDSHVEVSHPPEDPAVKFETAEVPTHVQQSHMLRCLKGSPSPDHRSTYFLPQTFLLQQSQPVSPQSYQILSQYLYHQSW